MRTTRNRRISTLTYGLIALIVAVVITGFTPLAAFAASATTQQGSDSVGLQGTITEPPPTQAATIATPLNGTTVTTMPVTVAGLCPKGLLIKVFSNNVFIGSEECDNGSYSIQVDLFGGANQLVATDYDVLDQAGPDSNSPTVTYNDAQLAQFGSQVMLTSNYAKRGANPGSSLDWPVIVSGGTAPYAISVDWGDNSANTLMSVTSAGTVTLQHVYNAAGVYTIVAKATDKNGTEAFLQLVGVANGAIVSGNSKDSVTPVAESEVLWWPVIAMIPLIVTTFWVGRRHELYSIRKQLEKSREGK